MDPSRSPRSKAVAVKTPAEKPGGMRSEPRTSTSKVVQFKPPPLRKDAQPDYHDDPTIITHLFPKVDGDSESSESKQASGKWDDIVRFLPVALSVVLILGLLAGLLLGVYVLRSEIGSLKSDLVAVWSERFNAQPAALDISPVPSDVVSNTRDLQLVSSELRDTLNELKDYKFKLADQDTRLVALRNQVAQLTAEKEKLSAIKTPVDRSQVVAENQRLRRLNQDLTAQVSFEQKEKGRHAKNAKALAAVVEEAKRREKMLSEAVKLAKEKAFVALDKVGEVVTIFFSAITGVETGGNYNRVSEKESPRNTPPRGKLASGLTCHNGTYCDYAYGRYQVMGDNIPSWTLKYLGIEMTPEEYLKSPDAQDTVARMMIAEYRAASVTKDMPLGDIRVVAAMWHSGSDNYNSTSADSMGTTTKNYVNMVVEKVRPIRPDLTNFPVVRPAKVNKGTTAKSGGSVIQAVGKWLTPSKK